MKGRGQKNRSYADFHVENLFSTRIIFNSPGTENIFYAESTGPAQTHKKNQKQNPGEIQKMRTTKKRQQQQGAWCTMNEFKTQGIQQRMFGVVDCCCVECCVVSRFNQTLFVV